MNRKKIVLTTLKIVAPIALIAWLLSQIDPSQLEQLRRRPLDLPRVGGAFALTLTAVILSFVRWFLLVRAIGLRFRLADAFRLGFLGYLFNFVSAGSMGGDLFKAVFIAREQPGRRVEAAATVLVDRIAGLGGLLAVTSLALALVGLPQQTAELLALRQATYIVAGVGLLSLFVLMLPGFTTSPFVEMLVELPKIGQPIGSVVRGLRLYRKQPTMLALVAAASLLIHLVGALAVYLLACALFDSPPSAAQHLVIVPLANVVAALPITPVGLGTYEFAMEKLYELWSVGDTLASGVTVALAYRLLTIGIASVGVVVYWTSRREVAELMQESADLETQANTAKKPPDVLACQQSFTA